MKKLIFVLIIALSTNIFAQKMNIPKMTYTDYWIDYDNLKNVTLGLSKDKVEIFTGEPRKIISLNIVDSDTILVVEYSVKVKNIIEVPISKPMYHLQKQNSKFWGERYALKLMYKNNILVSIY